MISRRGKTNSHVTVHHLLTMSSGIPDVWRLPAFWTTLPKPARCGLLAGIRDGTPRVHARNAVEV